MSRPTTTVFDLDGTLIESRGDIAAALNHALESSGRPRQPDEVVATYVGSGARTLCARALRLPDEAPEVSALLAAFLAYYIAHPVVRTTWLPGALEALDALEGVTKLALCTNKSREVTDAVLRGLGVTHRFVAVVAGNDLPERKPHPSTLQRVADLAGVPLEGLLMVGDSPIDIACAKRAGIPSVGVFGGFATDDEVREAEPDHLLVTLHELPALVRRLCS